MTTQQQIGIKKNRIFKIISGCRVAFDPRSTAKINDTRSDENGVSDEHAWRKANAIVKAADARLKVGG